MRRRQLLACLSALPLAGCLSEGGATDPAGTTANPTTTAETTRTTTERDLESRTAAPGYDGCETGRTVHEADVRLDADAAWPMYRYDARNSGYDPSASVPSEVSVRWRYSVCHEVDGVVTVADGAIYPGRARIDGENGTPTYGDWRSYQRPAVVDGTLYVGGKTLDAYDATDGSHLWTFDTSGTAGGVSAPTVHEDTVYITGNVVDSTLYAVDANTGEERWQFVPDHDCNVCPATDGARVYVVDQKGVVYGVDSADGTERWRHPIESVHNGGPLVVADGAVYVGVRDGVFAVEASDGSLRWDERTPNSGEAVIGATEDAVFVTENTCHKLATADGTERWRNRSVPSTSSGGGCCITADTVLVGGETLSALSRTSGERRWQFEPRTVQFYDYPAGGVPLAPAVVDGTVFAATAAGDLYALGAA